ncbi:retropepsin-like aspartic protease [Arenicella xantha]|uniref:Clan AA aspartic protease (TIGR02281 family) n=1 Tax=Arenicella xantha TaxID=644221 RepID=A0A395JSF4_9GAMM|nr:retropepsin-like aspartic protease [Arenicella xantha]RBP53282.1 clan AA aspartic protease (TIGR02281 family) [Arenicella xantha]
MISKASILTITLLTDQQCDDIPAIRLCYLRYMKILLALTVSSMVALGLLAWTTQQPPTPAINKLLMSAQIPSTSSESNQSLTASNTSTPITNVSDAVGASPNEHQIWVARLLEKNQFHAAIEYINEHYSALSSEQLDQLKFQFLNSQDGQPPALERLNSAAKLFDDLSSWSALAQSAVSQQNWEIAHIALLRVSELESRPIELQESLAALVRSSSYLKAIRERNQDFIGVRELYSDLHQTHPWYPRFQLELAHAEAALGDYEAAEKLYTALRFDPEFGAIATQALKQLEQNNAPSDTEKRKSGNSTEVLIPLTRTGTSLLINALINGQTTPMLLDTGASITALSSQTIQKLGLKPTGRRIQINTANGARSAKLFFADTIRFGQMQLSNLEVAEIDLGSNSRFTGLLGTDALSAFNQDFDYAIDQRRNALVFTPQKTD